MPPKPWETAEPLPRLPELREDRTPYQFQDWAIRESLPEPVFGFGLATGLGKSYLAYDRLLRIRHVHPKTRAIALTNKSATLQFAGEYRTFYTGDLKAVALHDRMDKLGRRKYAETRAEAYRRFAAEAGDVFDMLVMNYSLFRIDIEQIRDAVQSLVDRGYRVVFIPDEATNFGNQATQTHRCVNELTRRIRPGPDGGSVSVLTATFTRGKLEQTYHIFCGVELGHVIARDWEDFLDTFCICSASRRAMVPKTKMEEVYYYIAHHNLDGGVILGLRPFKHRFNIAYKTKEGRVWACLSKHALDEIRLLCCRHPQFQQDVPTLTAFYDRLGVVFEEKEIKEEPVITGYKNLDLFVQRTHKYMVILRKSDVSKYLPSFVPRIVRLEHTPEQRALIRQIYLGAIDLDQFADLGDLVGDQEGLRDSQLGLLPVARLVEQGHIRRALLDPRLVHKQRLNDVSSKSCSPKTEELIRFLRDEATGERIIVYVPSKMYLKLLAASIRAADGLDEHYADPLEIHGDVNAAERERRRALFQTSPLHRLILLNDAGVESLNLQAASILYLLGLPPTGGQMIQLAGRPSRLGSEHSSIQLIYSLIEGSQDEDDYLVIHRQMYLISLIQGEAEKGLLDHSALREIDGVDDSVSDLEYMQASLSRLTLVRRPRRLRAYGAQLPDAR